MSLINISHMTFCYDGNSENVFTDVTFQLDTSWKIGFCGRNGRGKTTFLKLLMDEYEYSGKISAGVSFDYFPYPVANKAEMTLTILGETAPSVAPWEIQKEFSLMEIDDDVLYRPFETLSNGEQTKVLLVGLFLRGYNFLLIDEPTNHLDSYGREIVAAYLNKKSGFILVSHDRAFLDSCTDYTLSINKANIEVVAGSFSIWWEQKQRQDAFEQSQNKRLSGEIDRLKIAASQTASWSDKVERSKTGNGPVDRGYIGHKSAKMMKRAKATEARRQSAALEKSALLKNIEAVESLKLSPLKYRTDTLMVADKLAIAYGEKSVCQNISFTVHQGDRIALIGGNGSGKSSILRAITGQSTQFAGDLHIGSGVKTSYVPQDVSFLKGNLRDYAKNLSIDITLLFTILRKLDFSREHLGVDMATFSEGQKKKILLAGSLCEQAHLYIWDEPLNYIDVYSRMQVEELILTYQPT
ncbi:MAG: ATP-binding cassette domain-containing protein, partial [Clostridiales Family XIII bacterium]|nr:ATP-binding cassette domain-containing protein [Clostridiales Family XIII bacterium]